jgi:hypothetical protein
MTDTPRTFDELRAIEDPEERANAATAYIEAGEQKLTAARKERDKALKAMVKQHGLAETARRTGLSQSTVKIAKGRV